MTAFALLLVVSTALPSPLSLQEALRIFRERGFDLLVSAATVEAAEGDLRAAAAFANPQLSGTVGKSFNYDPSQCAGCSALQTSVGLSDQGVLFDVLIGKRGLRRSVAAAALEAAKLGQADARRTLEFQLKQQFLAASLSTEQARFAREVMQSSGRTRELMQRRFSAGAIGEADLAKTEVAELEAQQLLDQAEGAMGQARAAVAFLLGADEPVKALELDTSALQYRPLPIPGDVGALFSLALQHRPDLRAFDSQVERAQMALSLARRQRIPDLPLSVTYSQEGSGQSAIQPPTLTFGAQLSLPIFYQQQGEIRRAEADLRTQVILRAKARAQIASDVSQASAAYGTGKRLVERMQDRLLGRAKTARDLVRIQYEKGAASLLELLDAERTYIATHGEYVQDLSIYWTAVAQLEQAAGMELRQ